MSRETPNTAICTVRTKEVKLKGKRVGWKVYINGRKFPMKPDDYFKNLTEEEAIMKAIKIRDGVNI